MSGLGTIITIIIVIAWIVKGLSSAVGNDENAKPKQGRSLEEWDDIQAERRAAGSERQDALADMRAQNATQDPAQMTMAQRIELARQRARQQAGLSGQDEAQAEALRRARQQAERQAQQQQQNAEQIARQQRVERQRAAQQQAQRERVKQQRRRQAKEQAEQEAQQRQRSSKQQRRNQSKPQAMTGSRRESIVDMSIQRVQTDHDQAGPTVLQLANRSKASDTGVVLGPLSRANLRKAFIMKELLDKPVALRHPDEELYW